MVDCLGNRLVVLGTGLFAALYLIAGAMMASVGLVTFVRIPYFFKTGCVIWSGFVVFLCGFILLIMSLCNKYISLKKSGIMILLSAIILIVSIINIILIELVEWKGFNSWETSTDISSDSQNTSNQQIVFLSKLVMDFTTTLSAAIVYQEGGKVTDLATVPTFTLIVARTAYALTYLTYLFGLLGSVIGLVTSIAGIAYIYFTQTAPVLKALQQRKGQREVPTRKSIFDKYRKDSRRKFTFKMTPPPQGGINFSTMANWDEEESDPYHVSWVYDDQGQETRPITTQRTPGTATSSAAESQPNEPPIIDNKALLDEIRQKVSSRRRLHSTSLDVTAQVNIIPSSHREIPTTSDEDFSEPVLGRIGQLPPNARSSFRRRSLEINRHSSTPL